MCPQFEQLKNDFRYNLGLLEDRDSELEKYDAEQSLMAASLADKEQLLAELQRLHADAMSGGGMTACGEWSCALLA